MDLLVLSLTLLLMVEAITTQGTYNNVKLLSGGNTGTWRGATANVVGSGGVMLLVRIS